VRCRRAKRGADPCRGRGHGPNMSASACARGANRSVLPARPSQQADRLGGVFLKTRDVGIDRSTLRACTHKTPSRVRFRANRTSSRHRGMTESDPVSDLSVPCKPLFRSEQRDPQSQAGRTICASIQNNSVLPQGRRLGVLAQSNPSKSGGVRLEAAFKPRGADHVYTPEASDPL
jgi:hypothetical protein